MKRALAKLGLLSVVAMLAGCYVDPNYDYVRREGVQGDVYYGQSTPVYEDGYYAPYGYDSYYGYGGYAGCCYTPGVRVGVSRVWYGQGYRGQSHVVRPQHPVRRDSHRPRRDDGPRHTSPPRTDRTNHGNRGGANQGNRDSHGNGPPRANRPRADRSPRTDGPRVDRPRPADRPRSGTRDTRPDRRHRRPG